MASAFDPDAAAKPGSGLFGLPFGREDSRIIVIPAPFDATTSYGGSTRLGPAAVRKASVQVDLCDPQFGEAYRHGIFMEPVPGSIELLSRTAREIAEPLIQQGGAEAGDEEQVAKVNAASERVNRHVHDAVAAVLAEGKFPVLLGGDHSTPFGAILACEQHLARTVGNNLSKPSIGVLHIDAHMDLRESFEGFTWSHASIMFNVLTRIPHVTHVAQVGIRDFGAAERGFAESQKDRVRVLSDLDIARQLDDGRRWRDLCDQVIEGLPHHVYVSFDIDGLDPSLCPHTGTPVPGGLSFNQATALLQTLRDSGRRIVGADLVEVSPGPDGDASEWDANVGARLLYKLCALGIAGAGAVASGPGGDSGRIATGSREA